MLMNVYMLPLGSCIGMGVAGDNTVMGAHKLCEFEKLCEYGREFSIIHSWVFLVKKKFGNKLYSISCGS